jgi:two-component system chemotaxis response regulator CheB
VCSGLAQRGTEAALHAVEAGAVAVVAKPQLDVRGFLLDSAVMLRDTVRGAAQARVRPRGLSFERPARARESAPLQRPASALGRTTDKVVAIGASTGRDGGRARAARAAAAGEPRDADRAAHAGGLHARVRGPARQVLPRRGARRRSTATACSRAAC